MQGRAFQQERRQSRRQRRRQLFQYPVYQARTRDYYPWLPPGAVPYPGPQLPHQHFYEEFRSPPLVKNNNNIIIVFLVVPIEFIMLI